ncbi:endonuclease [Klebsiella pneumoniae]|nr:endonuclease [Klebsiella pneumoniae]SYB93300.1 endonuclease [Klebsiella pneumoniae]
MKNLATWLLAAAFTTAALPAFAVEPSVQVGYSPEGSARVLVLSAIDSAKTSIRMMAYSFTAPDRGLTLSGTKTHVKGFWS